MPPQPPTTAPEPKPDPRAPRRAGSMPTLHKKAEDFKIGDVMVVSHTVVKIEADGTDKLKYTFDDGWTKSYPVGSGVPTAWV